VSRVTALLSVSDVRLDEGGVASLDGLTMETAAERVVVVGAPRVLFEAASGVARPARGAVRVRGLEAAEALSRGLVAGAPLDPPLPADWTSVDYATWSGRLSGLAKAEAQARAIAGLEQLGLRAEARWPLGRASLPARRATVLAAALATGARTIALEDPTTGLDDDASHALGALVVRALEERAWVLFAARAPLTSELVASSGEALVIAGSSCVDRGVPAALAARARRYAAFATGRTEALAARMTERGARVESVVSGPGSARFVVELAEGSTTRDLFACAEEAGAVVVELRPIALAFA
jgi:ABC-type multidrug transport system ATPase subunit